MAWIKVETHTPDKQEIRHIARSCNVSKADAFSAWFRLWSWFDGETADGHMSFLTMADCDEVAKLPGIGKALAAVQWIEFSDDGGAIIFNWDRHNGESAKKRAVNQKRMNNKRKGF
jgi:hypothetical protein